jgi:hypothetical protein
MSSIENHPDQQFEPPVVPAALPVRRSISLFAWIIIILIVLAAILGIANLGVSGLKAVDQPITGPSGSILYATTFDKNPEEWSRFDGQLSARIDNSALKISVSAVNDGAFSVLNYDFGDFDARMSATRLTADDQYNEIGLLFRYKNPSNYYIFKIRGDGFYRVERRKDGVTDVLSEWHGSPAVITGLGQTNQLRVVGKGDIYQFFINDQALILCPNGPGKAKSTWSNDQCLSNNGQTAVALQDNTFRTGKIGAGVRVDTPNIEVAFDNVLVYAP